MVFTLHRYILKDLLKIFILASIGLTLILSLGSILRPIQEYGVGPMQVIKLLGFFLPVTLTFVLPIGALFAATLVYGRFASDNELTACKASGISLFTLIYPGMALAIVVSIVTLLLSFHVIPAYIKRAEEAVKADAKQILFRTIERSGYYELPGKRFRIYADGVLRDKDQLLGVIVTDRQYGALSRVITAKSAQVRFKSDFNYNQVSVVAQNAHQIDADGQQAFSEWLPVTGDFPPMLSDQIKFYKIDDMKKIQADLTRFSPIAKQTEQAYRQLVIEVLAENINQHLTKKKEYYQLLTRDKILEFTAEQVSVSSAAAIALRGNVVCFEYNKEDGAFESRWVSETADIRLQDTGTEQIALILTMDNPQWETQNSSGLAQQHIVKNILLPRDIQKSLGGNKLDMVMDLPNSLLLANPSRNLLAMRNSLQVRIKNTLSRIAAEINTRLVFGVACLPLILIGIALGILLRDGHSLTAFGASAIPAAVLGVFIMMGKNMTKNPAAPATYGVSLMWVGLMILIIAVIVIYRKILKT